MVQDRKVERWAFIPDFPMYMVSDEGGIYNRRFERPQSTTPNTHGHMRTALTDFDTGHRHDKSLARLVAEAFVEKPNSLCTEVAILDGDLSNIVAENLVWRPRWFVWKYSRQLKEEQPVEYCNLPVREITQQKSYKSIVEAGMKEGLIFSDIWRSTYTGEETFPHGQIFQISG